MASIRVLEQPPAGLFWSAPLATDSDFNAEDPLALDYLGQQVGLWLFPRFTTRTSRAQNYSVVLYGLDLADRVIREHGYPSDDATRVKLFERWERFWALATLEYNNGHVPPGHEDGMRGLRGATRVWTAQGTLPTDFPLISRQSELGGLGAYLSSLRDCGLVFPGSLRVTPAAREILDSFWVESEEQNRATSHLYDEYARSALDLGNTKIPRKHGIITLAGIGKRSRLSALKDRREQRDRLWNALFLSARDASTLPLANQLIAASEARVEDPEQQLDGMIKGCWEQVSAENSRLLEVARAFGRAARMLIGRFDRAYGHVDRNGWVVDKQTVAAVAFPPNEAEAVRKIAQDVLAAADSSRFRKLQFHGSEFLDVLVKLGSADSVESLDHLLAFHRKVQKARHGGGSWLREDPGKLVIQVAGYTGYKREPSFPSFKLNTVRSLLADLGRIQA